MYEKQEKLAQISCICHNLTKTVKTKKVKTKTVKAKTVKTKNGQNKNGQNKNGLMQKCENSENARM